MAWRYKRKSAQHLDGAGASYAGRSPNCPGAVLGNIANLTEKSISLEPGSATGAGCLVRGWAVLMHGRKMTATGDSVGRCKPKDTPLSILSHSSLGTKAVYVSPLYTSGTRRSLGSRSMSFAICRICGELIQMSETRIVLDREHQYHIHCYSDAKSKDQDSHGLASAKRETGNP